VEDIAFEAWPKTPRLFRDCVVTEKIDGTNAAVIVTDDYRVGAQSRKRIVTPEADNYGFAAWVAKHETALAAALGPGRHFGEWWGQGIQRRYGLEEKRFSLFNVHRYADVDFSDLPNVGLVPVLGAYTFSTEYVREVVAELAETGSKAAPGFMNPEGVIVFHAAAGQVFKVLIENDDESPKGATA
jgi:hypothetical protein